MAILLRAFLLSMSIISRWSRFLVCRIPIFIAIRQLACAAPVPPGKVADGVVFHVGDRLLKLDVCADDTIRVADVNFSLPDRPGRCGSSGFTCAAFH
ncbi:MAG TPA: hypothetical protein VJT54_09290 [Verrucomicrobiae bacterium]|nr:hypothetical protein [Verrucomicrobiae bacterium]